MIRVNPWVELEQSTAKIMLRIFPDVQKDIRETTTVSMVNAWVELYESIPKAILHNDADFAK